jgi:chemosensory pili system protein ChpA (sensor histidine kinase/response regulator)
MRDFVNAGRIVRPARDLVTRIQLVARGVTPEPAIEPPVEARETTPIEAMPTEGMPDEELLAGETFAEPVAEGLETGMEAEPEIGPTEPAVGQAPVLPGREAGIERAEMARVDADLLDTMLNNAGEVSIFRARLEQQLSSVDFNLAELSRVVQRLKEQLRKLEIETEAQILHRHIDSAPRRTDFDPLELDRYSAIQQYSRALGETAADVASIQGLLGSLTREAQNLLTQQGRIVSDLQNSLMRTRMVPFQRHVQRLTRIVRQAASELGKRADLTVTGAAGELDRQVLDRMLPPFEHLVRNAVVHGIESPEERLRAGKPESGRIELSLRREGSEVVIVVADDGAGINLRAVREKAIALGIASPKQDLSDEQATQLILEPGFTTAGRVTQSAGRGVGMDVVVTEIKKLGGALFIDSEEGRGTRFTVRLPFTLAISQALVVRAGEEYFALPLPTVEGVVRVPAAEVERQLVAESAAFEYGGQQYRFQHLSTFVGGEPASTSEHDPAVPVILIRAGEHSTGIVTDELIGSREIVVKSVGPQIAGIRGISGATILGDGRICIILDVGALVRSEWRSRPQPERPPREREDNRLFALVVDDSITVRRVTQRLLERNGMRVMTAKDGLDAIAVLQDHVPDVILLDIEMPRMDGYEVASHVRNDPRLKDVPIVMITSRVGEKHRARAIELGVNDYLGKPYQEAQLLQALEPLLQRRRAS